MKLLPPGKDVVTVFADFLRYLFSCAKGFILDSHPNGSSIWDSVVDHIEFVLAHPNGWEGLQQGKMRQAAVLAGLVPDSASGHSRVHFVTEAEASLHYCIDRGLVSNVQKVRLHLRRLLHNAHLMRYKRRMAKRLSSWMQAAGQSI